MVWRGARLAVEYSPGCTSMGLGSQIKVQCGWLGRVGNEVGQGDCGRRGLSGQWDATQDLG